MEFLAKESPPFRKRSSSLDDFTLHEDQQLEDDYDGQIVQAALDLIQDVPIRINDNPKIHFHDIESSIRSDQQRSLDESFMSYTLAEKSALMIQQNFRSRHPEFSKTNAAETKDADSSDAGGSVIGESDDYEAEEENPGQVYTLIVVALFGFGAYIWRAMQMCYRIVRGSSDMPVDEAGVGNATGGAAPAHTGTAGGGGGAGGAPPQTP